MKELIKTKRLELTGEFEGMWVDIRSNPPIRVYEEFASGELPSVKRALATMTRASNISKENDEPIDLTTVEGWGEISHELIGEIAMRLKESMEPPKATQNGSPMPTPMGPASSPATTT